MVCCNDPRNHSMIFLLDNYDSFTYNLVQRIGEIDPDAEIHVERNDRISIDEIAALAPKRIIISPGPVYADGSWNFSRRDCEVRS